MCVPESNLSKSYYLWVTSYDTTPWISPYLVYKTPLSPGFPPTPLDYLSLIHATFLILTSFNTSAHSVLWPKSPWGGTLWAPEPQIYLPTGHYYLDTSNNLWKISKTELIIFLPKCMPIILPGLTGLKTREISWTPF